MNVQSVYKKRIAETGQGCAGAMATVRRSRQLNAAFYKHSVCFHKNLLTPVVLTQPL